VELLTWIGDEAAQTGQILTIFTLEGEHEASLGDWIVKGPDGNFSACKPDIFAQTYEPLAAEPAAAEPPPEDLYLIWSTRERMWWKPRGLGYTKHAGHAGLFPREYALGIFRNGPDGWFASKEGSVNIPVRLADIPERDRPPALDRPEILEGGP